MSKMTQLLIILVLAAEARAASLSTPGVHAQSLVMNGIVRNYLVYVPQGLSGLGPRPLLFNFHGLTSSAAGQMKYSETNTLADREKCIVVYPQGILRSWEGLFVGPLRSSHVVDDVAFFDAMVSVLIAQASIDRARIYCCGLSNGGALSYILANERSKLIAAIVSVAGAPSIQYDYHYAPARRVPVMQFHGTADPVHVYTGTDRLVAIEPFMATIAKGNGCSTAPVLSTIGTDVTVMTYPGGTETILVKIAGGGHTWPGSSTNVPVLGPVTHTISANDMMWKFFKAHPLPTR
jgi:polyhydroxybutyrate depolymerase